MRTHLRNVALAAALLSALAPALAEAQTAEAERAPRLVSYFLAGGGVMEFTDAAARDRLDTGGTWELRLGVGGLRYFIAAEVAYIGSSWGAGALGGNLRTHGLEGALRLQLPLERGRWLLEPFAFAGLGWTRFDRNGSSGHAIDDTVIPVGGGLTLGYKRFLLDSRLTYRRTFDDETLRARDGSTASLDSWAFTAALGHEF